MSYIINKTDSSVLTEITDGTVDQTATDITLIGKNASTYGEFINENFVKILENFANTSQPNNPLTGQVWYDTSEGRLKVYDGNGFKVSGGTIVSGSIPSSIAQGDIWIDSTNQQMYFNDGSSTVLVGPIYTSSQGYSGFQVLEVVDVNEISHSVVLMYVAQVLIGIYSKDEFVPANTIPGFVGTVKVGFNAGNLADIKFRVPVEQADSLLASDGVTLKTADDFLSTSDDSATTGTLSILNSVPLVLGPAGAVQFSFAPLEYQLNSNVRNQNFQLGSLDPTGLLKPSIYVDAENSRVGVYTSNPQATLDVAGSVIIAGNLTVNGTTTSLATVNLEVEDKNIILGNAGSPSDATAEGGGITLLGTTSKTFVWESASEAWNSSEYINLPFNKSYKINNFEVLTYDTLPTVTSAPSLSSIGALGFLQVDKLVLDATSITYTDAIDVNGTITLAPKGSGSVDVSSKKITNLALPDTDTDAVNVSFLNTTVKSTPLGFALDITGLSDGQITAIVTDIFPVTAGPTVLREPGTVCRVHCIIPSGPSRLVKQFVVSGTAWAWDSDEPTSVV